MPTFCNAYSRKSQVRQKLYAASPVYRLLLRLAAWFPVLMERKMVECVQHLFREPADSRS